MSPRVGLVCVLLGSLLWLALLWSIIDEGFHPHASPAVAVETVEPDPWTTTTTVPLPDPPTTQRPPTRAHETAPIWDRLADCESNGRWDDTRGGYFGGLHFMAKTWVDAGGQQYAETADKATRAEQIEVARRWLRRTSVTQWPVCGPLVGLTMADAA